MTRKRKPERYARHTYPEMRRASCGVFYIYWTNQKRESLKTRDRDIAIRIFTALRRKKREEELEDLDRKEGKKECPMLSVYIKEYVKWRENDGCAEATVANDGLALNSLLTFAGDRLLSEVDRHTVDLFHADLQRPRLIETKKGNIRRFEGCRRASVNAYIRHIKHSFYKAAEWGYIEEKGHPYYKFKPYEEPEQPFRELSDNEITEKLLPAIKEDDFRAMVQLYLQSGARAGELCSAHRDWIVEIEDRRGEKKRWLIFPETKRHSTRKIPITGDIEEILKTLPEKGYLFPRWRLPQSVSHKLKRILRSIGRGDQWLHGLRHNTGTKLARQGHPVKVRMKLLGHKQLSTMLRYDHPDDDDIRAAGDGLHFKPILPAQTSEPPEPKVHNNYTKRKKH